MIFHNKKIGQGIRWKSKSESLDDRGISQALCNIAAVCGFNIVLFTFSYVTP